MVIYTNLDWIREQTPFADWVAKAGHVFAEQSLLNTPPPSAPATTDTAVLVTSESDIANLKYLLMNPALKAILSIRDEFCEQDLVATRTYIEKMTADVRGARCDGVISGTEQYDFSLKRSDERWQHLNQLSDYLRAKPVFETFPDLATTVASELLTNAFYNAPQDASGRPLQPDRAAASFAEDSHSVDLSYGDDGDHVWIRVKDSYGSFNREKLIKHLLTCANRDKLVVKQGEGGAGIGLFMVFRWASELVFIFEPGKQTSVIVRLFKTKRMKVFDSQRVHFEVIERE